MVNETEVRGGVRSGGILGERESLEQQREEHPRGETCPKEGMSIGLLGPSAPLFPDIPHPHCPTFRAVHQLAFRTIGLAFGCWHRLILSSTPYQV